MQRKKRNKKQREARNRRYRLRTGRDKYLPRFGAQYSAYRSATGNQD